MSAGRSSPLLAILAVGPDRIIGRSDGRLPWRVPEDLAHFASVTADRCLIVGRTTFDGLPPLPGRHLIVVTRHPSSVDVDGERVLATASTPELGVSVARASDPEPIVAGGASLYAALWSAVRTVWWTRIDRPVVRRPGDVVLPSGVSTDGFDSVESRELADGVVATRFVRVPD